MELPFLDENGTFRTILSSTFKNSAQEDAWWSEQKKRYCDGYGNITGRHYFHLCWGALLDNQGNKIRPVWRDGDSLMFESFDEAAKKGWDLAVFKRKEAGFSTIFLGCMPLYNAYMYPNSLTLVTSCDSARTTMCRYQKLAPYMEAVLPLFLNPGERPIDNAEEIVLVNRYGNTKYGSTIKFPETSKTPESPTKFAGSRAVGAVVDEMLLHPRATSVKAIASASLNTGTSRTELKNYRGDFDGFHATFVMGGSADSMDNSAAVKAQEIYAKAKATQTKVCFIPFFMNDPKYLVNGFSQKDKAMEAEYIIRKRLEDGEAWDELNLRIRSYPKDEKELFDASNKATYGSIVPFRLKESRQALMNSKVETLTRCRLERIGATIEMKKDPNGNFYIRKMPIHGHTYIRGDDPIPFNTQEMSDQHSKFASAIFDVTANEFVAYFLMRDPDENIVCPEWEKLCVLYASVDFPKGAPGMFERNAGAVFKKWCKDNYKLHLLLPDPTNPKEYGYYKTGGTSNLDDILLNGLVNRIRTNGLEFLQAINEFMKSSIGKSDLLDAMQACLYGLNAYFRQEKKELKKTLPPIRILKRGAGGKTYYDYVTEVDENE